MSKESTSVTDKIGLVSYLCMKGYKVLEIHAKNKNRANFTVSVAQCDLMNLEQEYMHSDFFKFFEQFRWLREQVIRSES